MSFTELHILDEVFSFSGQSAIDTWALRDDIEVSGHARYSRWLVNDIYLTMQGIRDLADEFPFWQRRKRTGRPPVRERDLMIGFLLRQLFDTTFSRQRR